MTDRELLELAAKAAGIEWCHIEGLCPDGGYWKFSDGKTQAWWNPLTDDGDALRLAVKLGINLMHSKHKVKAGRKLIEDGPCEGDKRPDPYAATRRAIVRAAAEIATKTTTISSNTL